MLTQIDEDQKRINVPDYVSQLDEGEWSVPVSITDCDPPPKAMCELAKLRSLCVQGCYRITEEGKAALKASLPKCEFTA